ncbi:MAG: DUF4859 domain-containing protein [Bacteroidaceae bacterium]|nr:DUF4859 domain-containing protein [Bacteroidaceae bacterium]
MTVALDSLAGSKVTYNTDVVRNIDSNAEAAVNIRVSTNAILEAFGYKSVETFHEDLSSGDVKFLAKQGKGNATYSTASYGNYGFWFTKSGYACSSSSANRCVAVKYEDGYFYIDHNKANVVVGDVFTVSEMFIHEADTVLYSFNVTIGNEDSYNSNQPEYREIINHRQDIVDTWPVTPHVQQNNYDILNQNYIQVRVGDKITMGAEIDSAKYINARYSWKNRLGKTVRSSKALDFVIESATTADAGYYTMSARLIDKDGNIKVTKCLYFVDVQTEEEGTDFSWEGRVPKFSHDWSSDAKYNYGVYTQPTKVLGDVASTDKNGKKVNRIDGKWWTCVWGSNLNTECGTDTATINQCARNMMKKYDDDFEYIRENMGWPPDLRARNGYKSLVYIFGSGLRNDSESNITQGGYQSAIWYSDPETGISTNWPCVWASYYPFSRFRSDADSKWSDGDYQREAMVHEGIHAIFADLDACKKSSWFHEAGNTWLQSAMNTERDGVYGTPGFLDACPFIAPFMPIECYSGWLQDGSFGGPTAQGVNMYTSDGRQICTWRNLLGGTQYGNSFPIVLAEICGKGSIPWIWRNCSDYVLKGIGNYLGDEVMRDLIMQYRARQATFDIGGWKSGYRSVTDSDMGVTIKAEYNNSTMPAWIDVAPFKLTPYQTLKRNSEDYWMAPDTLTNPGWSGANIIPIHVDSKANKVVVEFRPEDTEMRAQLCYVTKDGKNYYSQPVHCGKMVLNLTERPSNEVVFAVICNTDYVFVDDEIQRKHHWDYRIRFGEGALQVADPYCRWYFNERTIVDENYDEASARILAEDAILGIEEVRNTNSSDEYIPGQNGVKLVNGLVKSGQPLKVYLDGVDASDVKVNMIGLSGIVADNATLQADGTYMLPKNLSRGLYFIKFIHNGKTDIFKVIIR